MHNYQIFQAKKLKCDEQSETKINMIFPLLKN